MGIELGANQDGKRRESRRPHLPGHRPARKRRPQCLDVLARRVRRSAHRRCPGRRPAYRHPEAKTCSRAVQTTRYLMGQRFLESLDVVAEFRVAAPNEHHFLVELSPFGVENMGEVFIAADRLYGLIETTVEPDDVAPAPEGGKHCPLSSKSATARALERTGGR